MAEHLTVEQICNEAREYADGQFLMPTAVELDRMRELLRILADEVARLRGDYARDKCEVLGDYDDH